MLIFLMTIFLPQEYRVHKGRGFVYAVLVISLSLALEGGSLYKSLRV